VLRVEPLRRESNRHGTVQCGFQLGAMPAADLCRAAGTTLAQGDIRVEEADVEHPAEHVVVPGEQVHPVDRFEVESMGKGHFKIVHVCVRVGYQDRYNVPDTLALARKRGLLERNLDLEGASYLVSRMTIRETPDRVMNRWRKRLFVAMARNAASPIDTFGLPSERTVMMGSQVPL